MFFDIFLDVYANVIRQCW